MRRLLVMATVIAAAVLIAGETAWACRLLGHRQRCACQPAVECCEPAPDCCGPAAPATAPQPVPEGDMKLPPPPPPKEPIHATAPDEPEAKTPAKELPPIGPGPVTPSPSDVKMPAEKAASTVPVPPKPATTPEPLKPEPPKPEPAKTPTPPAKEKPAAEKKADIPLPEFPAPVSPKKETPPPPDPDKKASADRPLRQWTDSSGKYSLVARFVAVLPDTQVRLQKQDGSYARIETARLSAADRVYVDARRTTLAAK
jgi:hypothetical protein